MFKPMEKIVSLTDTHMGFLCDELKLSKMVGINSSYSRMNNEDKMTTKKECYDYFMKKNVLRTDFFGTATVSPDYTEFSKLFENPEYHAACYVVDYEKNNTQKRKLYYTSDKWIGLEYYTDEAFVAGVLEDEKDAIDYFMFGFNNPLTPCELSVENLTATTYKFSELNKVASLMLLIEEYTRKDEVYEKTQMMYLKLKNNMWATLESDDGENAKIILLDITSVSIRTEV